MTANSKKKSNHAPQEKETKRNAMIPESQENMQYWDNEIENIIPENVINRGIIQSAYKGTPIHQAMLGVAFLPFAIEPAQTWLAKAAEQNDLESKAILEELEKDDSDKSIIIWWSTRNFSNTFGSPKIFVLNRATDKSLNKYVYRNAIIIRPDEEDSLELFEYIRDNIDNQIIPDSEIISHPLHNNEEEDDDNDIFEDLTIDLSLGESPKNEDISDDEESSEEETSREEALETAKAFYKLGAEMDNPDAQYNYGMLIYHENESEAREWIKKAAQQGYTEAEFIVGSWYFEGDGVTEDIEEATKLLQSPAEKGLEEAQLKLGLCYATTTNPLFSVDKAEYWLGLSAKQGNETAIDLLNTLNDPQEGTCEVTWWSLKEFGTDGDPICTIDWKPDLFRGILAKNQTTITITQKEALKLESKPYLYEYIKNNLDSDVLEDHDIECN